jgi:hypothetical protein
MTAAQDMLLMMAEVFVCQRFFAFQYFHSSHQITKRACKYRQRRVESRQKFFELSIKGI